MVETRNILSIFIILLGIYLFFESKIEYRGIVFDLSNNNLNVVIGIFLVLFGIYINYNESFRE